MLKQQIWRTCLTCSSSMCDRCHFPLWFRTIWFWCCAEYCSCWQTHNSLVTIKYHFTQSFRPVVTVVVTSLQRTTHLLYACSCDYKRTWDLQEKHGGLPNNKMPSILICMIPWTYAAEQCHKPVGGFKRPNGGVEKIISVTSSSNTYVQHTESLSQDLKQFFVFEMW